MFNWEKFKSGEIAVRCDTKEKANNFLKECSKQKVRWFDGDEATEINCWGVFRTSTTYACTHGNSKLSYGNAGHYKNRGLEIIDWRDEEMEKSFKEVIADIKEGEVWENKYKSIRREKENTIIENLNGSTNIFVFNDSIKYKLKRKQYTFEEAFKAYEEGKEIESCEECRFKLIDKDKTLIIDCAGDEMEYSNKTELFSVKEIRGKWYIND